LDLNWMGHFSGGGCNYESRYMAHFIREGLSYLRFHFSSRAMD
jgi:hypothetical protein